MRVGQVSSGYPGFNRLGYCLFKPEELSSQLVKSAHLNPRILCICIGTGCSVDLKTNSCLGFTVLMLFP